MNFTDYSIKPEILDAITKMGFETPTDIQKEAVPFLIKNPETDFIGLAQTGTGKTAAFGLPVLTLLDPNDRFPEVLILSPTRELCLQITEEMRNFSRFLPGVSVTAVYGGASIGDQIKSLKRGTRIVVATPGRLVDLINRKRIDITQVKHVVLDEADIMLNMGFKEELDTILEETPDSKRVILFSATMPPDVSRIASTYMEKPKEVTVGTKNSSAVNIKHNFCMVHSRDKFQALKRMLDYNPGIYGIVFCRTRRSTQQTADQLIKAGYNAESLHGDLSQAQRDLVMNKFRNRNIQILVATDVAARGLDVDNLTHVIHYDLPDDPEGYIHRSGRTGRAGRTGISLSIINMKEKHKIKMIERRIKDSINPVSIPDGEAICEKQLIHLIDRVHTVDIDEKLIAPFLPVIEEKLASLDRDSLLKHFVSLEFNRFLSYYQNSRDINVSYSRESGRGRERGTDKRNRDTYRDRGSSPSRGGSRGGQGFDTIQINLGRKDRVLPPQIIGVINEATRLREISLGRIDIETSSSFIQVESDYTELVLEKLAGSNYRGKTINASRAGKPSTSSHSHSHPKSQYRKKQKRTKGKKGTLERGKRYTFPS